MSPKVFYQSDGIRYTNEYQHAGTEERTVAHNGWGETPVFDVPAEVWDRYQAALEELGEAENAVDAFAPRTAGLQP